MISFLRDFKGFPVALDTMIFIYAFEEHPTYLPLLKTFFRALEKGDLRAVTSTITVTECLVQPYRKKDFALAAQYLVLFRNFPHLSVVPVSEDIAERAAFLRAEHHLSTPDAIQLATGLVSDCRFFLTNDEGLPSIEGISVLLLDHLI